jgi:serine/threonine-protein kinase
MIAFPAAIALGNLTQSSLVGIGAMAVFSLLPGVTYCIGMARRLLMYGFAQQDLGPAFASEIEQGREERAIERRGPPSFDERIAPTLVKVSGATLILSWIGTAATGSQDIHGFWEPNVFFIVASTLSFLLLIVGTASLQKRGDVDSEFWAKIWKGRLGKWIFSAAKRFVGKRGTTTAVTHRATELSLGLAAEQLFETLPRETRRELAILPDVLHRLQEDAQLLRRKHNELNDALADCTAGTPEYVKVRDMRDEMQAKLTEAVSALETIRLNLLRLHAGAANVQSLTTHLSVAADVSAAVERLVSAHEEVDRTLKFPRTIAPSPA